MEETVNGEKINNAVAALLQFFMGVSYRDAHDCKVCVYSCDGTIDASIIPDIIFSPQLTVENEYNFMLDGDIFCDSDIAMLEEQMSVEVCAYSMLPFLDITGITNVVLENEEDKEKFFGDIENFVATGKLPEKFLHPLVVCDVKNMIGDENIGYERFVVQDGQARPYNHLEFHLWSEQEKQQARTFAVALYNAKRFYSQQPLTFEHSLLKIKDFPLILAHNQDQYLVIRVRDIKSFMVGDDIYKGIIALAENDNTQYTQEELLQIKNAVALSLEVQL